MLRCFILSLLFLTNNVQFGDSSEDDSKFDEGPVLKVIGGNEATPYSRPWIGQLFYNGRFRCGCSLISNQYALTTAHCVKEREKALKNYHIVFGGHSLKSGTSIGIKRIISHPEYDNIAHYNAALLLLDGTISETDKISIIRLAEKSPGVNDKCIVDGWGTTGKGSFSPSNVLKEIKVNIIEPNVCSNISSTLFDKDTMICVNESQFDGACSGDSGGPLLCSNNNEYYEQHGIVSLGLSGCEVGITAYTDVSKILLWIYDQVGSTTRDILNVMNATNITEDLIKQTLKNFNQESFDQLISTISINWADQNQETLLHISARYGYFKAAGALINKNSNLINAPDKYHWYPLHYAAFSGQCDIISLLLEKGASVNSLARFSDDSSTTSPSVSPLYLAARKGHVECVRILLNNGAGITHKTHEGLTALHEAAREGNYDVVKLLIERGANVNIKNNNNETPLHYAARDGHCDIVNLLVENGADVNAFARFNDDDSTTPPHVSALYLAARYGNVECVRILLDKGADINHQDRYGYTALHIAAWEGKYEVAKLLIEEGADSNVTDNNGKTALQLATNKEIVDYLVKHSKYPVHSAVLNDLADVLNELISSNVSINTINEDQQTALHIASKYGYFKAADALINKDSRLVNVTDKYHWYPLHCAAWNGHCNIVSLLLENGADVNALAKFNTDNSTTPPHVSALQLAAHYGSVEYVLVLLDNGADINHQTNEGLTALHVAYKYGKYEIAKLLVESGADAKATDNNGKTALQLAKSKEIIDYVTPGRNSQKSELAKF